MGNWIPGDPTLASQILKISSAYTPPPPEGFISPMTWGIESNVIERFEQAGISRENITCERDTYTFIASYSPAEFANNFRNFYGPTMNAFEAAEKNGRADELEKELVTLFNAQNQSGSEQTTLIPATFLMNAELFQPDSFLVFERMYFVPLFMPGQKSPCSGQ